MKDAFKSWFFCKIPFSSLNFEPNVLIRRSSFEFYDTIVRTFRGFQMILRSFLFIKQFRIKYVKFITLDCFWGRIIITIVLSVILIPLYSDSSSINILWFFISESSLSLTRHPVVKLFFVFLKPFVFFKFDNLLSNKIDCYCWIVDNVSSQ